ncbi:hypothetical protein [Coleofasciculus sp. FACHB-501]|uniref:hypothetical protein n=1 Tax=Cyanophyceae TaxID=3028117 RepID=UPI001682493F|nr:hypothetical protein [Coleofasciculus sp. FACHB-501]MBD1837726.1 hypothetical protein [Coleofasciculus sp. FACHB-501]
MQFDRNLTKKAFRAKEISVGESIIDYIVISLGVPLMQLNRCDRHIAISIAAYAVGYATRSLIERSPKVPQAAQG